MDEYMRGMIESGMDETINHEGELSEAIQINKVGLEIKSFRDFAAGYMVAALKALAITLISSREVYTRRMQPISDGDMKEIDQLIQLRYPAILERVTREANK